jgi:hypothetical protein
VLDAPIPIGGLLRPKSSSWMNPLLIINNPFIRNKMEKTKSSTEKNEEYIQKLAPSLPKFEKVKNGVYKFRCVFCGDSKKNPNKRSGYFYLINNSQNYRCFKCNHRSSLKTVLQELKPELYMEYIQGEISNRDRFGDVNNQKRMDRIHKYVSDLSSFDEGLSYFHRMKKHSSRRFKEITKMLREEGKKRREKKEH